MSYWIFALFRKFYKLLQLAKDISVNTNTILQNNKLLKHIFIKTFLKYIFNSFEIQNFSN